APVPAFTLRPFTIDARTPAIPAPPSMVMALLIVTAPSPPGSSALISPFGAVLEIAPAKVFHGAVRLQGLASSPTPDTHVRDACALAEEDTTTRKAAMAKVLKKKRDLLIFFSFELCVIAILECVVRQTPQV